MTYVNPGSCVAISVIFLIFGILAVSARFYTRAVVPHHYFGADDWFCLPALAFTCACCIVMIVGVNQGAVGYHSILAPSPEQKIQNSIKAQKEDKIQLIFLQCSIVALGCIKLSGLFFFRRFFAQASRVFSIINWSAIVMITAWAITIFFIRMFECGKNVKYIADGTIYDVPAKKLHCQNISNIGVAFPLTDVITDLIILCIPMYWIWSLEHLSRGKKLIASLILSVGGLATAAAFVRAIVFAEVDLRKNHTSGRVVGVDTRDSIGTTNVGLFWSMMEMGLAMIAINLPSLRPLLKKQKVGLLTRFFGKTRTQQYYQGEEMDSLPHYALPMGNSRGSKMGSELKTVQSSSEVTTLPVVHLK